MEITRKLLILTIFIISIPAYAADHTIEMLSSSDGQMMVFKPAVLKINPGDTVTWKAANPGHNTASINEMSPDQSLEWNGKINEELKITFTKEGVYGYKCTPHYILGMVGIVSVGDTMTNLSAASEYAISAEKKFATNKDRFSKYISELKN
jgi:pseudoazurin